MQYACQYPGRCAFLFRSVCTASGIENLAYSIYCSVYVSEHTHDAVLQLVDRLRRQDFLCEYMQESEYIYMLQIFLSDKEKLLHIGSCFTDFIAQQNEYTFLYIENIFPVTTDWKHIPPAACTF